MKVFCPPVRRKKISQVKNKPGQYFADFEGVNHLRFMVGWACTTNARREPFTCTKKKATARYDKPEIINSDKACQFTCLLWTEEYLTR